MCFSAQASFSGAVIIGAIGIASVATAKPHLRKLAFTPLVFAFQQAIEGILWLTLEAGDSINLLIKTSTYLFMIFATMFWPLWIPSVLYSIEENTKHKKWLQINIGIGFFLAFMAGVGLLLLGWMAEIVDYHINYTHVIKSSPYIPQAFLTFVYDFTFILYLLPTIGSFFISTLRGAWLLGVILAIAWIVNIIAFSMAFASVWCFFGAWASIIIFFIVKK